MKMRVIGFLIPAVMCAPTVAAAQTVSQVFGYLNVFVGIFFTASILMFTAALIVYFIRYGTMHREEMFPYMQGAITILFVLSVLLALIRFFQKNTATVLYILGFIVLVAIVIFIIRFSGSEKEKKEGGRR